MSSARKQTLISSVLSALILIGVIALNLESREFVDLKRFKSNFYQVTTDQQKRIISSNSALLLDIVHQRTNKIWGPDAEKYLQNFSFVDSGKLYLKDSVLIQRRACWRSRLFAKDVEFIEISLYTTDGANSIREMYAVNPTTQQWAVVDSAGSPQFERLLNVTADQLSSPSKTMDFFLTTLAYAGYGNYAPMTTLDTNYHDIEFSDSVLNEFYPYKEERIGDTLHVAFTTRLIGGVDITRWRFSLTPSRITIEEQHQLISYLDLPELDKSQTSPTGETSAIDSLLSDVTPQSGAGSTKSAGSALSAHSGDSAQPANTGGIRLTDLIGGAAPPPVMGHVSYEIVGAKPYQPADSVKAMVRPEFASFVEPLYPPPALEANLEGSVEIMGKVDTLGKLQQAMVIKKSDNPRLGFELSAKNAAQQTLFKPGTLDGEKADIWLTFRYSFKLASTSTYTSDTTAIDSSAVDSTLPSDTIVSDTSGSDTTTSTPPDSASSDSLPRGVFRLPPDTTVDTTADSASVDSLKSQSSAVDSTTDTTRDTTVVSPAPDTVADTSSTPKDSTQ